MPKDSTTWEITRLPVVGQVKAEHDQGGRHGHRATDVERDLAPMKPCITTWPEVPTLDEDSPEASSATAKASAAPPPTSCSRPWCAACSESRAARRRGVPEHPGGDEQHGQVDQPGRAEAR